MLSDLTTESRSAPGPGRAAGLAALLTLLTAWPAAAQFTSGVNVVEVYVSVTDRQGQPVTGLDRGDFTVYENGDEQQVTTFAAGEFPLAVAVALDRSFSMAGNRLAAAKSAARIFLGELRPDDQSMILAVGSRTEVVAPLSRERQAQLTALAAVDAFGTTGLYDAIIAAIEAVQPGTGRRALVLLSDGSDRYSRATAEDVLAHARAADVLIYPVAFGESRPAVFAELAALTGGRSFHIRDARRLPETVRAIAAELRHQYLLGYSPSTPIVAGANEWRSIGVSVDRPRVSVRARDGYRVR